MRLPPQRTEPSLCSARLMVSRAGPAPTAAAPQSGCAGDLVWNPKLWHIQWLTFADCLDYINILLFCVPIGIVAGARNWDPTAVFLWNFFGIIPLAAVLSFATEEISVKLGETLGGLLNATFGNAVELIVSIVALKDGQLEVVQASMLGSILSNLLLVLGMCFLFGGLKNMRHSNGEGREQAFASGTAQTTCSLMALSSASMILPATVCSAPCTYAGGVKVLIDVCLSFTVFWVTRAARARRTRQRVFYSCLAARP